MQERLDAAGGVADGSALLDRQPRHVQLRHLAQRGRDDCAGRGAGGARLAELRLELGGAARKGGIDQPVERQRRGVGDHGHDVVELDLVLAAGVERELAHLVARRQAVAAEQRNER